MSHLEYTCDQNDDEKRKNTIDQCSLSIDSNSLNIFTHSIGFGAAWEKQIHLEIGHSLHNICSSSDIVSGTNPFFTKDVHELLRYLSCGQYIFTDSNGDALNSFSSRDHIPTFHLTLIDKVILTVSRRVHDLSVPLTSSFLAQGLVVHNCLVKFYNEEPPNEIGPHGDKTWSCFDDRHQVLTQTGFKWINDETLATDQIAAYNPQTNQIEYHACQQWINNPPRDQVMIELCQNNYQKSGDSANEYGLIKETENLKTKRSYTVVLVINFVYLVRLTMTGMLELEGSPHQILPKEKVKYFQRLDGFHQNLAK